jgi:hypothetical protein
VSHPHLIDALSKFCRVDWNMLEASRSAKTAPPAPPLASRRLQPVSFNGFKMRLPDFLMGEDGPAPIKKKTAARATASRVTRRKAPAPPPRDISPEDSGPSDGSEYDNDAEYV